MDDLYYEILPDLRLRRHIETFWVMEVAPQLSVFTFSIRPDLCSDLIFDVGGTPYLPFGRSRTGIVGVMTKSQNANVTPGSKLLGIRFKPYGATSILGLHPRDIVDQTADLSLIGKNDFDVRDELLAFETTVEQINFLNRLFISKLKSSRPIHSPTARAVEIISRTEGCLTVSELADIMGFSRRHLTRIFTENTGLAPKEFIRLNRFRSLLRFVEVTTGMPDWSQLALQFGFYDQAHLCSEFSSIMDTSPNRYWKK